MNAEQIFVPSKPVEGRYPAGPHKGKVSLTGVFRFGKEIPTRTGKKMAKFHIGTQKCICFDTLAEKMIRKANTREGQESIAVGRYRNEEFIADWAYSTELRSSASP